MTADNKHMVWWKSEVEKRTNGGVEVDIYTSGALASAAETLSFVKTGVVDMGLVVPAYYPSDLPASQIVFTPFMATAPDIQLAAFKELYESNASLQQEWEVKNNVKILLYYVPSDQVGGATKQIKTINELKGMKMRALGDFLAIAEKLGATPVTLSMTELYHAIGKGTIDGFLSLPYDMVIPMKLHEVTKFLFYWKTNAPGGSMEVMNMDFWNKLSPDIQQVLMDLRNEGDAKAYELCMANEVKFTGIMKKAGVNTYFFPPEEVAKIKALVLPGIYNDWVVRAENAGVVSAQKLLDDWTALIAKYTPESIYESPWIK